MPPKAAKSEHKKAGAAVDQERQAELAECQRLQERSFDKGVIARSRQADAEPIEQGLPSKLDGMDVIKKNSVRKNRYLLNVPAQLKAGTTAGRMGSLAQLDTRNPVLYIDFPEGRLKFQGTIVFPRQKYMTLRLSQKNVMCEDTFESMIVFCEHYWIGTKEQNPDEDPLPMPSTLQQVACDADNVPVAMATQDLDGSTQEASQPGLSMRSSQRTAAKRPLQYTEVSSDDADSPASISSEDDDSIAEDVGRQQPGHKKADSLSLLQSQPAATQPDTERKRCPAQADNRVAAGSEQRPIKRARQVVSSEESEEEGEEEEENGHADSDKEDKILEVPSQRTLPARTARQQAKQLIAVGDNKSHEEDDGIDESEKEDEEFEEPEDSDYEE